MRIGFEVDMYKGNSFFMNLDILNVLDSKNTTILDTNYAGTSTTPRLGYEIGRQFWLEFGYRF